MRIFFFLLLGTSCLACSGCATMSKAVIESMFSSISISHSDDDDEEEDCEDDGYEIDPYILKRKGIEPGSKRHRKLVAQETMYRDFRRRAHTPKDSPAFASPQTFEELIRSSH